MGKTRSKEDSQAREDVDVAGFSVGGCGCAPVSTSRLPTGGSYEARNTSFTVAARKRNQNVPKVAPKRRPSVHELQRVLATVLRNEGVYFGFVATEI